MYIPKNRIITNLYTYGEEYQDSNSQDYIGYYHKLYNGRIFSGKTPNDSPIFELFKYSPPLTATSLPTIQRPGFAAIDGPPYPSGFGREEINIINNQSYILAKEQKITDQTYNLPYNVYAKPTPQDYQLGMFQRYFVYKINTIEFTEVNKEIYENIKTKNPNWAWKFYNFFSIPWELTGNKEKTYLANRNTTLLAERRNRAPGLSKFLRENYLKFYKE